jgi:hypothetical protein
MVTGSFRSLRAATLFPPDSILRDIIRPAGRIWQHRIGNSAMLVVQRNDVSASQQNR